MPDRFERLHVDGHDVHVVRRPRRTGALMAEVAGVEHVHVDLKQGTAMVVGSGDVLTLGALVQRG